MASPELRQMVYQIDYYVISATFIVIVLSMIGLWFYLTYLRIRKRISVNDYIVRLSAALLTHGFIMVVLIGAIHIVR